MRFGYALLGLVTLVFVHTSSGENSLFVMGFHGYSSSTQRGRGLRVVADLVRKLSVVGYLAGDVKTR